MNDIYHNDIISEDDHLKIVKINGYDIVSELGEIIKRFEITLIKCKNLLNNTDENLKEKLRTYISTGEGKLQLAKILSNGDFEKEFC